VQNGKQGSVSVCVNGSVRYRKLLEQQNESHTCDKTAWMLHSANCLDRSKHPAGPNSCKTKTLVSRIITTTRFQASHFSTDRPSASLQLVERTIVHAHTAVDFVVSNAREGKVRVSFDFLRVTSTMLRMNQRRNRDTDLYTFNLTYHYTTLDKEESAIHIVVVIIQYITGLNLNCSCMLL
jgi:hypothetical protein